MSVTVFSIYTIISQLSLHEVLSEAVQNQKECTCNSHTYILSDPPPPSSISGLKLQLFPSSVSMTFCQRWFRSRGNCTCNRHIYTLSAPTPPSSILGSKFLESVSEVVQRNTRNVDIVHTSTSSIPLLLPHHFRFLSLCLPFPFNDASFPPLTAIQPSQSINIRPV